MGIEPTQAVLETASPALEHSPLYPAFAYPPERVRVLSNARFNAGKSNGPSRSHALLTGHNARQVRACRNIAPVRCQLWDLAQTAGLEPAHTSWRGALPTELRLRMSPLGHFVREPWTRGARGPMPNRNCTGASRASTSCRRRAAFAGRSLYIHGALAETHHPKTFPAMVQTAGLAPASSRWHHQSAALLVELRLHINAGLSRLSNPIRVPL